MIFCLFPDVFLAAQKDYYCSSEFKNTTFKLKNFQIRTDVASL